jgi:hypothetical protein
MANLPYYPMYPKDFDSDKNVRLMDDCDLGLFIRCLNHSWTNDGLPTDPEEIRRSFRDNREDFLNKWKRVEPCFPIASDGMRRNPRQEKERIGAIAKHKAASDAGKRSVESRRHRTVVERPLEGGSSSVQTEPVQTGPVPTESVETEVEHEAFEGTSNSQSDSGSISISECEVRKKDLISSYAEFMGKWAAPCTCCQREFDLTDSEQGARVWISLVETNVVTAKTFPIVLAGLDRYRASKKWHEGFVCQVPKFLGYSKEGRPSAPLWNDRPEAFKPPEKKGRW